jgi:hypothetical protein
MESGYYYNVQFKDEWLEIKDFVTVQAESGRKAKNAFKESERYGSNITILSVEEAFRIPDNSELLN